MSVFEHRPEPHGFSVRMAADLSLVERLAEHVNVFLEEHGLEEECFDILLVMREAMTNAVVHGSKGDDTMSVDFRLHLDDDGTLVMRIRDQGAGFDRNRVSGDIPPATSVSGRGLAIMQSYFDTVDFGPRGNSVTLRRQCDVKQTGQES